MTRLEIRRSLAAGRVLSELWDEAIATMAPALPTLFVPVPLHPSRLRERGYNQASSCSGRWPRLLRIPLAESLLARTRATPAQANSMRARAAESARRFEFHARHLRSRASGPTSCRTGRRRHDDRSDAARYARVLRRAGIGRVDVWASRARRGNAETAPGVVLFDRKIARGCVLAPQHTARAFPPPALHSVPW
jgi:hypothetical protein